jgi:hypothetical protein
MGLELGDRLAAALKQTHFDLHHQHVARPVVLQGLGRVPAAGFGAGQLVQQRKLVVPGQLCKHPLHKCHIRPRVGKGTHVLEVAPRKPLHLGKRGPQVMRQPLDHLRAPALRRLSRQDVAPDLPILADQNR